MLELNYGDLVEFQWCLRLPASGLGYDRGDCGIITETDNHDPLYYEVELLNTNGARTGKVFKIARNKADKKLRLLVSNPHNTTNDIIQKPVVNGIYRHFKGSLYVVQATAIDVTTNKEVVVYFSSTTGRYFTRPLSEFFSNVSDREDNYLKQATRFMLYSGD